MESPARARLVTLDAERPIWEHFFTVAPLVVVGTREGEGYNLAPKHMATPLGWGRYFGFVCTPRHATYHNAKHWGAFTVSFPRPTQVVLASLTASPRCDAPGHKPVLDALPTFPAEFVDGVFLQNAYLFLECEFDRVVDVFGPNSLVVGRIVAAYVHEDALRQSEVDDQQILRKALLLAYVSPGRYAALAESYTFPLPADFQY